MKPSSRRKDSLWKLIGYFLTLVVGCHGAGGGGGGGGGHGGGGDVWPLERPEGMTQIQSLEVMCGKDHMDVHLSFTHPFEGIVFSKGQYGDHNCVYVRPATGRTFFSFRIAYTRCGTKPDLHGQFYENTVVVQYDKDLLEVWDEAKRLRCEWFNDYEKTASKPPMVIADLDVIQLDFRGDNVDCWMEIQHGKGPWAPPVSGIVPLGSTLTLVVAINDYRGEFDMRVKSCAASDGAGHVIQLSDENGCVLRPKMISRFLKVKGGDDRASVITYAFFHAFKFPDALSVHIKCKVEICRHGCLDHCQLVPSADHGHFLHPGLYGGDEIERKDHVGPPPPLPPKKQSPGAEGVKPIREPTQESAQSLFDVLYDELADGGHHQNKEQPPRRSDVSGSRPHEHQTSAMGRDPSYNGPLVDEAEEEPVPLPRPQFQEMPRPFKRVESSDDRFPHGPRNLPSEGEEGALPPVNGPSPRSLDGDIFHEENVAGTNDTPSSFIRHVTRRKRSLTITDRKVRSADVGVSGIYDVISEADLAFTPDMKAEAVTVFQGRIREEVVYGICLPMPGFSVLFVLVAVSAVVAALVAGSLLYRYQLQKEAQHLTRERQHRVHHHHNQQNGAATAAAMQNGWTNWMALRLLRSRITTSTISPTNNATCGNNTHSHDG